VSTIRAANRIAPRTTARQLLKGRPKAIHMGVSTTHQSGFAQLGMVSRVLGSLPGRLPASPGRGTEKKPAKFCLHDKWNVSDLESSSLAGFFGVYPVQICARTYNFRIIEGLHERGHHHWPDKRPNRRLARRQGRVGGTSGKPLSR